MAAELELNEDMRHQRREWRAEQAGWVAMVLILGAALAGLFGGGSFSQATAGQEESALWVDYARITRYQAPTEIKVHFQTGSAPEVAVGLNRDFVEIVEPDVRPEPERVEAGHGETLFYFSVQPSSGTSAVVFRIKPTARGRHQVRVTLDHAQELSFPIYILP